MNNMYNMFGMYGMPINGQMAQKSMEIAQLKRMIEEKKKCEHLRAKKDAAHALICSKQQEIKKTKSSKPTKTKASTVSAKKELDYKDIEYRTLTYGTGWMIALFTVLAVAACIASIVILINLPLKPNVIFKDIRDARSFMIFATVVYNLALSIGMGITINGLRHAPIFTKKAGA